MRFSFKHTISFVCIFLFGTCVGVEIAAESTDAERLFALSDIARLRAVAIAEKQLPPESAPNEQWILAECANVRKELEARHLFRRGHASFLNFITGLRRLFSRRALVGISVENADPDHVYSFLSKIESRVSDPSGTQETLHEIDKTISAREELNDCPDMKGTAEW